MAMLHRFDITSSFTLFFLFLMVLLVVVGMLLSRAAPKKTGRGRQKFDDTIVDRSRELID